MNREYAHQIIKKLLDWGVLEFYVCAGARNFPLIETVLNIQASKQIVFNHFEERSAAFYAIGRIKSLKKPVAVITTSGTAVGELFPAVMEAYYSGLPLVVITADRPRSYRGTGAPQAAEQKNIFGIYVSECFDLENEDGLNISDIQKNKPLHINICFDMPLQSGVIQRLVMPKTEPCDDLQPLLQDLPLCYRGGGEAAESILFDQVEKLKVFLENATHLIVIVSQIPAHSKKGIMQFLKKLNYPIYIESISNLRNCKELSHLRINYADKIWDNTKKSSYNLDSVIKIGGTPTHRFWRDLDETKKNIKVFSIHELPFSGIPHAEHITTHIESFFKLSTKLKFKKLLHRAIKSRDDTKIAPIKSQDCTKLKHDLFQLNDNLLSKNITILIEKYPKSEQAFFYYLSNKINKNANVYLGNSMPIRYWDLMSAWSSKKINVDASRGLNGIDGQLSTFLGFANESSENWGIFGDLTTLYDLAGPWMLQHRPGLNVNIVVINNSGGKIFSRVLQGKNGDFCQNTHNLQFQHFAKMWNLNYKKITSMSELNKIRSCGQNIFEIIPNTQQTKNFADEWDKT